MKLSDKKLNKQDDASIHGRLSLASLILNLQIYQTAAFNLNVFSKSIREMGLPSELEDIASDSLPIFLIAAVASAVSHLRAAVFTFLHLLHISQLQDANLSVLECILFLADQLSANIACSSQLEADDLNGADCVVCLCSLKKGKNARKLECRHVFHKKCLDGWLQQLHFTCPLCRSPVPPPPASMMAEKADSSFGAGLIAWLGFD